MNSRKKILIGYKIIASKLFKAKIPLVVGWSLTKRCNLQCHYCGIWEKEHPELDTLEVMDLLKEMAQAGVKKVSFTGGEPLLRQDIGIILEQCKKLQLSTGMNTNGVLVTERIQEIASLDVLKISIDGPKPIQDRIRGEGTFDRIIEAVHSAKAQGIKVAFLSVISRENAHAINELLELAAQLKVYATFQPATPYLLGTKEPNPLATPDNELIHVIKRLIALKRSRSWIGNSLPVLKHYLSWPAGTSISCAGGWISCRVEPDGNVYHCGRVFVKREQSNARLHGFVNAFNSLPPIACQQCWCAPRLEMNFIYKLYPRALTNIMNAT